MLADPQAQQNAEVNRFCRAWGRVDPTPAAGDAPSARRCRQQRPVVGHGPQRQHRLVDERLHWRVAALAAEARRSARSDLVSPARR
jgi:hypothetical protein